nr:hypothetical protein [uncultured Sellimonas sp.]
MGSVAIFCAYCFSISHSYDAGEIGLSSISDSMFGRKLIDEKSEVQQTAKILITQWRDHRRYKDAAECIEILTFDV